MPDTTGATVETTTANPTTATVTTQSAEPIVSTTTATNTNGEAQTTQDQAAPVEDSFTQVDPNSLAPKDRAAHDNMLRDYKRKTADIADVRRKAEAFDAWQANQERKRAQITDDDFNRAFENKEGFQTLIQKAAEPVVSELKATKQELAATKADLFVKDFKSKHADFDDLDSDGLITGYVQLNPPKTEREWETTVKTAYDYAKKLRSKWEDSGYKRGITRVQQKADESTALPSGGTAPTYSGPDPKTLTAEQAVELALKGIRVPQR